MSPDASGKFRGISVPRLPWLEDDEETPCAPCQRFRRGQSVTAGPRIHACERVPDGWVLVDVCPCGCDL